MGIDEVLRENDLVLEHGGTYSRDHVQKLVRVLWAKRIELTREDGEVVNGVLRRVPESIETWDGSSEKRRLLLKLNLEDGVVLAFRYGCRTNTFDPSYVFDNNYSVNTGIEGCRHLHVYPEAHSKR